MKSNIAKTALFAVTLLLSAGLSGAAETTASAPKPAASKPEASAKSASGSKDAKAKTAAKVKQVDINSASKEELKTLPGVKDAQADKIIAGRPYGSKAWLVTHNIVSADIYEGMRNQVIAKQPNKDAAKNAALYEKKK